MSRSVLAGAAEVDSAGAPAGLVGPGDVAFDGEVELEGAGAVPVPAVGAGDPGRQPVAKDLGDRPGRQVEQDDVGGRDVAGAAHVDAGVGLAAEVGEQ